MAAVLKRFPTGVKPDLIRPGGIARAQNHSRNPTLWLVDQNSGADRQFGQRMGALIVLTARPVFLTLTGGLESSPVRVCLNGRKIAVGQTSTDEHMSRA